MLRASTPPTAQAPQTRQSVPPTPQSYEHLSREQLSHKVRTLEGDLLEARKNAQQHARERSFLDQILSSLFHEVLIISPDLRILGANEKALRSCADGAEGIIGRRCYEVTHKRDRPCSAPDHVCPVTEALRTGKPATAEHEHFDGCGEPTQVEIRAIPMLGEDGRVERVVEVIHDITDRKRLESQRLEAERLKALIELAGGICHELSQPLQTIAFCVSSAAQFSSQGESLRFLLDTLSTNVTRMTEILWKLRNTTAYATTEYVQGTRILDLDQASRTAQRTRRDHTCAF